MKTTVTPGAPWGDIPLSTTEPVHYAIVVDQRIDRLGCATSLPGSTVTVDEEQVTCAKCLAAMTAPITEDHGPVAEPVLPGRLTPERLREVDAVLDTLRPLLDELAGKFQALKETHELTAAHQAMFDELDSTYAPASVQWLLTIAVAERALRRKAGGRPAGWPVAWKDVGVTDEPWKFGDPGADPNGEVA